jgi:hypothetical protein
VSEFSPISAVSPSSPISHSGPLNDDKKITSPTSPNNEEKHDVAGKAVLSRLIKLSRATTLRNSISVLLKARNFFLLIIGLVLIISFSSNIYMLLDQSSLLTRIETCGARGTLAVDLATEARSLLMYSLRNDTNNIMKSHERMTTLARDLDQLHRDLFLGNDVMQEVTDRELIAHYLDDAIPLRTFNSLGPPLSRETIIYDGLWGALRR